tara:strand:+ start:65 stop:412 length:348 start_codon:yes stop_codon:yes gene_type:complete
MLIKTMEKKMIKLNDTQLNKKIDDLIDYYRSCFTAVNNGLSDVDNNDDRNLFNTSKRYLANGPIRDALKNQLKKDLGSFFDTYTDDNDNFKNVYDLNKRQIDIITDSVKWVNDNF